MQFAFYERITLQAKSIESCSSYLHDLRATGVPPIRYKTLWGYQRKLYKLWRTCRFLRASSLNHGSAKLSCAEICEGRRLDGNE
jgi:hypothetical protein